MNILYLCDEYPPGRHGGIGTLVQILARGMVKEGHKVIVAGFYDWGYGGEDYFNDNGVEVYRFRRKLSSTIFAKQDSLVTRILYKLMTITGVFQRDIISSLKRYHVFLEEIIKRYDIDIVEMPDYQDYIRFCNKYVAFPRLSVPVVLRFNGCHTYFAREANVEVPDHVYQMEHDLLQQANAVASASKYTADKTALYLNYEKNIEILYNAVDVAPQPPVAKENGMVIFTGTLIKKKGIYQLMQAWNIVNEQLPHARLHIYGKGPIDKMQKLLNEQAVNTVFFKGHVSKQLLNEQLAMAELAVFPSYAECFALAPMEAMVCGTTVLYSTRTSGPELIDDGENGVLVDPDDIKTMADKIILLLTNKDMNKQLAEKGKDTILKHFDIKAAIPRHIAYYEKIIA